MKSNNSQKTYYLKTFGCQMNYADSEKIHMILMGSGFRKVLDPVKADIIVMNTCSVRQKGEDKVFGFMNEISKFHKNRKQLSGSSYQSGIVKDHTKTPSNTGYLIPNTLPLFGITGCMVRKTGVAKRYLYDLVIPNEAEESLSPLLTRDTRDIKISGFGKGSTARVSLPSVEDLRDDKKKQRYKRNNAEKITLLEGENSLMNYDDELFLRSPLIDFVFRIEEVSFLTKILSQISGENIGNDAKFNEYLHVKQLSENPASANVIIQTGCDNHCTYCIVPHTRGREMSRPIHEIGDETREVVKNGAKEITLLGQNVNSYGKETHAKLWNRDELTWTSKNIKSPFRELLDSLNQIDGLDRIRFTSSNPHDMTLDILDAHFELSKMCNYLHFALQSGSDSMLRRMNRKHTYADFKAQLDYLRSRDTLFAISTDIIVGFPGETEEEFQSTAKAMQECQFDFAYIARYSPRPGTIASDKYEDDISPAEKTRRWTVLNDILRETVKNRNLLMIGREEEILISGFGKDGEMIGRTRNFKEVSIKNISNSKIGDIVKVKITGPNGWGLLGEVI